MSYLSSQSRTRGKDEMETTVTEKSPGNQIWVFQSNRCDGGGYFGQLRAEIIRGEKLQSE